MTRLSLCGLVVGLLVAGAAWAQSPEDEWGGFQPGPGAPAQPELLQLPPPLPPSAPVVNPGFAPPQPQPFPLRPRPEIVNRPPEDRNQVSMLAAPSLGAGKRGQLVLIGFPLLSLRGMFGITDWLDLGVGFDSYYFLMNEPRLAARFSLAKSDNWFFAASLEGGYAFFTQRASRESRGSRWLTGRRNINISPAAVVAYQGNTARAARVFFELRYTLALDTEPYATDPLVGVPPAIVAGHNVGLKGGAELPLSAKTSFVFAFGFDIHGRAVDAVVMPSASLGLVTSL